MGTRHLTRIVIDQKVAVSQYGQWDGYPTGQGKTLAHYLRGTLKAATDHSYHGAEIVTTRRDGIPDEQYDRARLIAGLVHCYVATTRQLKQFSEELKRNRRDVRNAYPSLSRDTGARIVQVIQGATAPLPMQFEPTAEEVQWVWTLDLDKETLTFGSDLDDCIESWPLVDPPSDEDLQALEDRINEDW